MNKKLTEKQLGYLETLTWILQNLVSTDEEAFKYQYSEEEKFRVINENYVVSNKGRVFSMPRPGRFHIQELKPVLIGGGSGRPEHKYLAVNICCDGKAHLEYVHRLVGFAFVPGWFENAEINHKSEEKTSNMASNLEWCSRDYNKHYGTQYERLSETCAEKRRNR